MYQYTTFNFYEFFFLRTLIDSQRQTFTVVNKTVGKYRYVQQVVHVYRVLGVV